MILQMGFSVGVGDADREEVRRLRWDQQRSVPEIADMTGFGERRVKRLLAHLRGTMNLPRFPPGRPKMIPATPASQICRNRASAPLNLDNVG